MIQTMTSSHSSKKVYKNVTTVQRVHQARHQGETRRCRDLISGARGARRGHADRQTSWRCTCTARKRSSARRGDGVALASATPLRSGKAGRQGPRRDGFPKQVGGATRTVRDQRALLRALVVAPGLLALKRPLLNDARAKSQQRTTLTEDPGART